MSGNPYLRYILSFGNSFTRKYLNVARLFNVTWFQYLLIQEEPFAKAYRTKGEKKFASLSVIFAPSAYPVIILSSDDEGVDLPNEAAGKQFVLVGEEGNLPDFMEDVQHEPLEGSNEQLAIVPYQPPIDAAPLQSIPHGDLVDISSSTATSSLVHWRDLLGAWSDDEGSTATDGSTARSFIFSTSTRRGFREHTSRYKTRMSPVKHCANMSSTASNSPHGKPPRK